MRPALLLLILLAGWGCASSEGGEDRQGSCILVDEVQPTTPPPAIATPPSILLAEDDLLLQYWEFEDPGNLDRRAEELPPALKAFRANVLQRLPRRASSPGPFSPAPPDLFARDLLRAQLRELWLPTPDLENVQLVLTQRAGRLRPISRLEAFLLEVQLQRGDMIEAPSEFLALVLRRGSRLRIYYYTTDQPGIGGVGRLHEQLEGALAEGFVLERNLHNHNFLFNDPSKGPLGGLAPSTADTWFFRAQRDAYRLPLAVITNGFDSVEIPSSEFETFHAQGPR